MRRQAIPYRLIGSVRFYDRREIRDLMSYLKLMANPADDEAFRRAMSVPSAASANVHRPAGRQARAGASTLLDVAAAASC